MDMATWVQNLDEAVCILHSTNILVKKVWIQLFSLQMKVNIGQTVFFNIGMATSPGEGKLWIQIAQLVGAVEYTNCFSAEG